MDSKRRKFLKIAGLSAIAGIGAPSAFNMLLRGEVQASQGNGTKTEKGHGSEAASGVRLGMVIDIKKFGRYRGLAERCVNACHSKHNVPDFGADNKKDEIKWIWKDTFNHVFPDHSQYKKNDALKHLPIMTLCNHCDNPPCVRACPTKATFKNEDGIVLMDFHRCIGCRFCMAACPYGARSFNWRDPRGKDKNGRPFIKKQTTEFPTRMRGVVEKCNLCAELSAVNEDYKPYCVEATGNTKAMIFGDLNDPNSEISRVLRSRFTIQRKPALGTHPSVFYII